MQYLPITLYLFIYLLLTGTLLTSVREVLKSPRESAFYVIQIGVARIKRVAPIPNQSLALLSLIYFR